MENNNQPKLARRSLNRKSTIKSGRTIAEKREHLETASERAAVHKKAKLKKRVRLIIATVAFVLAIVLVAWLFAFIANGQREGQAFLSSTVTVPYTPTIEIIDEDSKDASSITARMKEFIGQIEADLREFGLTPTKAVIPSGAIREVDIYLDGYNGYIKTIIDRGAGVTAEDTDRMLRYLSENGITDFQYIDVRIDGKAYWK